MSAPSHSILRQVIEASSVTAIESQTPVRNDSTPPKLPPDLKVEQDSNEVKTETSNPLKASPLSVKRSAPASSTPVPPLLPSHAGHMKLLFDNAPVAMAMFDAQMRYLLANSRWLEDFKLQEVDVAGKSQYELFPSLHPGWRHVYERALDGQVVRCDRDAVTHDGKPVVYRWEVRPWRHLDTTIGGIMITCARIQAPASASSEEKTEEAAAEPTPSSDTFWESDLPVLVLDVDGLILRASKFATSLLLSHGLEEGKTRFVDVCGERAGDAELQQRLQVASAKLITGAEKQQVLAISLSEWSSTAGTPSHWLLSRISGEAYGEAENVLLAVGLTGLPATSVSTPTPTESFRPAPEINKPLTGDESAWQLKIREAQDAERLSKQRETRLRAVLDLAPCGFLVLDERARPIYQNSRLRGLLNRSLEEGQTVEEWLTEKCLDEDHREEVCRRWREGVWRKQITLSVTVSTSDDLLKDIEMRPVSLPGGGLMVMMQDVTEARRSEEMLRSTEAKFRALVHENPHPILLTDRSGSVFDANPAAETLLGYPRAELRRMGLDHWLQPESVTARTHLLGEMYERGDRSGEITAVAVTAAGVEQPVTLRLAAVTDVSGQPVFTIHYLLPVVHASPEHESLLLDEEANAAVFGLDFLKSPAPLPQTALGFESVPLLKTDAMGRIEQWTSEAQSEFGYALEDAKGRGLHLLFKPSDATGFYTELAEIVGRQNECEVDWTFFHRQEGRKTGHFTLKRSSTSLLSITLTKLRPQSLLLNDLQQAPAHKIEKAPVAASKPAAVAATSADAKSEVNLKNQRLLLGETHHRVKNHLQAVTSMLSLQMSTVRNEEARDALRSSQNRIRSIAALHQHLSQLTAGGSASFKAFAEDLIERLRELYDVSATQVDIDLLLPDAKVPEDWLLPLALSMNEMVANAFKHAFPNGKEGHLRIALQWDDQVGVLIVADNGIGLPSDFEDQHHAGMGLKILRVFAGQLGGEVKHTSPPEEGTEFVLHFPVDGIVVSTGKIEIC